jgi:hypothetical protein
MKKILKQIKKAPWKSILIFSFLLLIFFLNTFHEEYTDEYDNIVGGKFIAEGKLPYRDLFQHHQPFPYILSAVLFSFSGQSFVSFRILLSIVYFVINVGAYFLLKRKFKKVDIKFYLGLLFIFAISATYLWGQMLLADTLAAYLVIPAYAILLLKELNNESFDRSDLMFFSVFAFFTWLTSMTYIYLLAGLYLYAMYLYIKSKVKLKFSRKHVFNAVVILGFPFVVFFVYLGITGSLGEWYFAAVEYNQKYYIYNYPRPPGTPVNPIRYATIIVLNFFNNFLSAIENIKNFQMGDPLPSALALFNISFFVYILLKKKYALILPFLSVLIFSNVRTNPAKIKETDYQVIVYVYSSFLLGALTLSNLVDDINKKKLSEASSGIGKLLIVFLGIYWFFTYYFLGLRFYQKYHAKYMGNAPLIYNRPQVAPIINQITSKENYAWVGPYEPEEVFFLKAQTPSKYYWFLDHAKRDKKIQREMLNDYRQNRPKVVVFKRDYAPWGGNAYTFNYFFVDFLDENYFRLTDVNEKSDNIKYKWKVENTMNFNLEKDFNFDKGRKDEILKEVIDKDLIEETPK